MNQPKTLTAQELIAALKQVPPKTKIYISSDSEGNAFGTIDKKYSWGYSEEDKALAIYMFEDHLTDEQIQPLQMERITNELDAEAEARAS